VIPVDEYGASPASHEVRALTVDNENADFPGVLMGVIKDSITEEPIAGATVTVTPGPIYATSASHGEYCVPNVAPGTYTVEASAPAYQSSDPTSVTIAAGSVEEAIFLLVPGDVTCLWGDVSGDFVGAYDASLILQWQVCLIDSFPIAPSIVKPDFPPCADVSDNGSLSSYDASLILQKRVGLLDCFPADLDCNEYGPDTGAKPGAAPRADGQQLARVISLPATIQGEPGDEIEAPVMLDDATGVFSYFLDLRFDSDVLEYVDTDAGTLTGGWGNPIVNAQQGHLRVAGAGTSALEGSGSLVVLYFRISDSAIGGQRSLIHFDSAELNEGVSVDTVDGEVVVGPLPGTISGVVTDASTGAPIQGANVTVKQQGEEVASDTTNDDGEYAIEDLEPGSYEVSASASGYDEQPSVTVQVPEGGDVEADFELVPTDTDGDGLPDNVETNTGEYVSPENTGTNPLVADTDGDGLDDGDEVNTHGTNPVDADSDDDTYTDKEEIDHGGDPDDGNDVPDPWLFNVAIAPQNPQAWTGIPLPFEVTGDMRDGNPANLSAATVAWALIAGVGGINPDTGIFESASAGAAEISVTVELDGVTQDDTLAFVVSSTVALSAGSGSVKGNDTCSLAVTLASGGANVAQIEFTLVTDSQVVEVADILAGAQTDAAGKAVGVTTVDAEHHYVSVNGSSSMLDDGEIVVVTLRAAEGAGDGECSTLDLQGVSCFDPSGAPVPIIGVAGQCCVDCISCDVNCSETIDAVDVQLVINAALGLDVSWNCDIDGNEFVNAIDVQLVINAALGG